jgi:hypothetical protein
VYLKVIKVRAPKTNLKSLGMRKASAIFEAELPTTPQQHGIADHGPVSATTSPRNKAGP